MYQAICPDCGATITLNVPGMIWAGCPSCEFYGQVPALEPVRAERLAHLREQTEQAGMTYAEMAGQEWAGQYAQDVAQLLAEVERLRAREAALLAVVQAVANVNATNGSDPDDMKWPCCAFSRTCEPVWREHFCEWKHADDCPVTQARALLASAAAGEHAANGPTRGE